MGTVSEMQRNWKSLLRLTPDNAGWLVIMTACAGVLASILAH